MSGILIVILFGMTLCYAQYNPNICNIHPDNDRIPDYSNCTNYMLCSKGEPISRHCEDEAQFDPILRMCSHQLVNCFQCPSDTFFVDLPVDYACSQYIRCINGIATHHSCESGLLFDPIRRQCNKKEEVVCPCPSVDIPGYPLFVRDWSNCGKYNICANGTVALSELCAPGLYFSISLRQCIIRMPDCQTSSTNSVFHEIIVR